PVTYSVSRPSALGEIRIEVRTKTRPLTVVGVTPRGRPRIAKPKPTGEQEVAVDAESLAYDQASNTLTARGGVTLTRGDTTLTADEVVFDRTNQVAEAPSWSIAGRQTDITLQGKGIVRHMTFRVKDVPVFYFPYFVFPANTQRESGFLIPRIGYSNRRGYQYEQPFFWAISKSTDATI